MNKQCLVRISTTAFLCTATSAVIYASMIEHHDHLPHSENQIVSTTSTTTSLMMGTSGTSTTTTF